MAGLEDPQLHRRRRLLRTHERIARSDREEDGAFECGHDVRGVEPVADRLDGGDELLGALLQRLTGAEPARVRAVARTAASPVELPPALELVVQIGELLGLSGVDLGYEEALELPGALRIER